MNNSADINGLVIGFGQLHTNEADPSQPNKRLTPYATIDLEGIRALVDNPQAVVKEKAQWLIPSTAQSRRFKIQEAEGQYLMLWADLDQDPKPIADVQFSLQLMIFGFDTVPIQRARPRPTAARNPACSEDLE